MLPIGAWGRRNCRSLRVNKKHFFLIFYHFFSNVHWCETNKSKVQLRDRYLRRINKGFIVFPGVKILKKNSYKKIGKFFLRCDICQNFQIFWQICQMLFSRTFTALVRPSSYRSVFFWILNFRPLGFLIYFMGSTGFSTCAAR